MKLLTSTNAKTVKGEALGYKTFILYMAPERQNSLGKSVCPFASPGCAKACLYTAGRGIYTNVQQARMRKTELFLRDRRTFLGMLRKEIGFLYQKYGETLCIRLNGTSDLPYETLFLDGKSLMEHYPEVQFYDYTKNYSRLGRTPDNYHLTFSRSEVNEKQVKQALARGFNAAVVFLEKPDTFYGYPVVDGDKHDLTFLHPSGSVLGLSAKGAAKHDASGFVVLHQTVGGEYVLS